MNCATTLFLRALLIALLCERSTQEVRSTDPSDAISETIKAIRLHMARSALHVLPKGRKPFIASWYGSQVQRKNKVVIKIKSIGFFMQFFNFDSLYLVLITLLLVRFFLNRSNLATLVSLCLTSFLSFAFFESFWAFSPLVFFFLKDYLLILFACFSFFSGNQEQEKETVLWMKGKEEVPPIPEKRLNPITAEGQSSNPKHPSSVRIEDGRLLTDMPAPTSEIWECVVSNAPLVIESVAAMGFLKVLVRYYALPMIELYKLHGHTIEGRRFVDRRGIALGAFIFTFFSIAKLSGNGILKSVKEVLRPVLIASTPISFSPENQDKLKALEDKVEEVLGKHVYLKSTLSGEFIQVPEAELSELVGNWLKRLDVLLSEGRVIIDFSGFNLLPRHEQIRLTREYNALPDQWKVMVREYCEKLYPKMMEFEELAENLGLLDSNQGQGLSYPEQDRVSTRSQAPEPPQPPHPRYIEIEAGDLQAPDNPNLTVRESLQQWTRGLSPKNSHEEYSTTVGPEVFRRGFEDETQEQLELAESWTADNPNQVNLSTSGQGPTGSDYLTLSEQHGSPGNSPSSRPVDSGAFSNQKGTNPPEGGSAQNQLVARDQRVSDPFESPGNSPTSRPYHSPGSPLEETLEKNRYVVWIGSGLCAYTLLTTIKIAWVILKKLDYTQEVIKRLTDRGWPNWLFFFVRHSNPGPVGGKPLFRLMITILAGNVIVLYVLMRIIYLVS